MTRSAPPSRSAATTRAISGIPPTGRISFGRPMRSLRPAAGTMAAIIEREVPPGDQLGHDAHGDLEDGLRADVQAHRRRDSGQRLLADPVVEQGLADQLDLPLAADQADVTSGRRSQERERLLVVAMPSRDDQGERLRRDLQALQDAIDRADQASTGGREPFGRGVFGPVVNDPDVEVGPRLPARRPPGRRGRRRRSRGGCEASSAGRPVLASRRARPTGQRLDAFEHLGRGQDCPRARRRACRRDRRGTARRPGSRPFGVDRDGLGEPSAGLEQAAIGRRNRPGGPGRPGIRPARPSGRRRSGRRPTRGRGRGRRTRPRRRPLPISPAAFCLTAASTQPPPRVPIWPPSGVRSIEAPAFWGVEPRVATTRQRITGRSDSRASIRGREDFTHRRIKPPSTPAA